MLQSCGQKSFNNIERQPPSPAKFRPPLTQNPGSVPGSHCFDCSSDKSSKNFKSPPLEYRNVNS